MSVTGRGEMALNTFIEDDVAVNQGNNGGILTDVSGNLVGAVNASLDGPATDVKRVRPRDLGQ